MSNEMFSVEAKASDMCRPLSSWYEPSYSISAIDGLNHRVKNTPVISSTMNEYRAISPSRKDQ
jgi:hypothetical protein